MAQRVTSEKLNLFLAGGFHRVTCLKASTYLSRAEPLRVTSLRTDVFLTRAEPIRVSTLTVRGWVSLAQAIYVGEPFGSNEVYTPADVSQKATYIAPPPPVIEVNPFRADVPNVDQQRILREQHNKAQAGDSTFHWGVLTEISATPLYNLGSVGRFYHDQYGIAHAVYVRFNNMERVDAAAFPVGFDLKTLEPWTVTNQLGRSSRDFAAGVACIYNESIYTPGTWFGWIIIEGFVPAELKCELVDSQLLLGTEYGWSATGEVSATTDGDSLGIRWTTHKVPVLKPGEFRVRVNSLSQARLNGLIAAQVGPLSSQLGDLTTRVSQLEATSAAHTQQIGQLQSQIVGVDNRLSKDIANLANQMAALRRMIPSTDYESYVNTQVNALDVKLSNQIASVGQVALQANSKADDALGLIAGFNVDGLQNQIDALNDSMGSLTGRLTGFETVIDTNTLAPGMILVAIDAGLTPGGLPLVKFEPQVPVLELLDDIDLSTPPTDGQILAWDDGAEKWIPANQSGGGGGGGAPFRGARLSGSASSVGSGAAVILTFTTIDFDTGGYADSLDLTKVKAARTGKVIVAAGFQFANANSGKDFELYLRKNGTIVALSHSYASTYGGMTILSGVLDVTAGDYFDTVVWSSSTGGPMHTNRTWMTIQDVTDSGDGIPDAPSDGKIYGRKDAAWVEVTGGGGGGDWWFDPPSASGFTVLAPTGTMTLADDPDVGLTATLSANGVNYFAYRTLANKTLDWNVVCKIDAFSTTQNYAAWGVAIRDSVGGRMHQFGITSNQGLTRQNMTNNTSWNSSPYNQLITVGSQVTWFRIESTGSNLNFYVSANGKTWALTGTIAATSWLANRADQVGFMLLKNASDSTYSIPYWALTGPAV